MHEEHNSEHKPEHHEHDRPAGGMPEIPKVDFIF